METNTKPASSSRTGLIKRLFRWLFWIAGAVALFIAGYFWVLRFVLGHRFSMPSPGERICFALINLLAVIFLVTLLLPLIRWAFSHMKWVGRCWAALFTWRTARRALIGLAILATLLAVFYTVENWRGKRAWEQCQRDLAAKGEVLDWAAYIPAPIPDEENIIKAPKMADWFIKPKGGDWRSNDLTMKLNSSALHESAKRNAADKPILIAHLRVAPANSPGDTADLVIPWDALGSGERLGRFIQDVVGPCVAGSQSFTFVRSPRHQITPRQVLLQSARPLAAGDIAAALPPMLISTNVGSLQVEAGTDRSSFQVLLASEPTLSAEEYLAWSDQFAPEFELIRKALQRPGIRMDDDYQQPFDIPTVNFINIRNVAQTAAQRAQCCLLLGRPEQAFHELSLLYEMRRMLQSKPTTLVAAMIDVAVMGLYTEVLADGFRLQAWRELELVGLQSQLQQVNLLPALAEAFRGERAAVCRTLEASTPERLQASLFFSDVADSFWKRVTDPEYLAVTFPPRGWIHQNLATIATLEQGIIEAFGATNQTLNPGQAEASQREILRVCTRRSPYTIVAAIVVPNFLKAAQAAARNQTRVNQVLVVCGLERYRLARGGYPETLDALLPKFLGKLPNDVIGGQPLHYRRTPDGKFLLYSVGWNETDDGGEVALKKDGSPDYENGDWVWPMPTK